MKTSTSLKERLPRQQNGDTFPFVMLHGSVAGNVTTGAESITELVGELISGYDDIPQSPEGHDQALGARYDQAVGVATTLQGSLAAQAAEAGVFDPSAETEEALTALFTERTNAFEGIHDGNGEITLDWQHAVPLVLIDTDYAPFTARPRPSGRIVWMSPAAETTHLQSLHDIGLVVLTSNA